VDALSHVFDTYFRGEGGIRNEEFTQENSRIEPFQFEFLNPSVLHSGPDILSAIHPINQSINQSINHPRTK